MWKNCQLDVQILLIPLSIITFAVTYSEQLWTTCWYHHLTCYKTVSTSLISSWHNKLASRRLTFPPCGPRTANENNVDSWGLPSILNCVNAAAWPSIGWLTFLSTEYNCIAPTTRFCCTKEWIVNELTHWPTVQCALMLVSRRETFLCEGMEARWDSNYQTRSKTIFWILGWSQIENILKRRKLLITFKTFRDIAPDYICNMFAYHNKCQLSKREATGVSYFWQT